jgi:hypothetical protein
MITPILKDPKSHGGTLYTFPSASRDLTRAFSNSEYEFAFSHFACLNLPDFKYGSFTDGDSKGIYLDDIYPNCIDLSKNLNTALKWHLQSYVMNYEVAILNGFSLDSGVYDNEILRTPSERIFFNWLKKVNGIKFNGNSETIDGYGVDIGVEYKTLENESQLNNIKVEDREYIYRIGNKLYKWKGGEWRSRVLVSKTVQYIGTIDMINNVNIDYDSFNEIYLNIPAGVGKSTNVFFNYNIFDKNYKNGEIIDVDNDKYCTKKEYIIGRDPDELYTDDVTLKAIYDSSMESENAHTYKIDSGYCIDFSDNRYSNSYGSIGIDAMNLDSNEDFEFNCVLIYYRIRKGGQWYTNLYGVLFLEEVSISDFDTTINDDDEIAGYIQRYPKFKNGNSWGLKLDLKIDAQPDSQMELRDKEYDDPNDSGLAMQMFTEALMQLNDCSKLFYEVKKENTDIEERLYTLENIMSGVDNVYDLIKEVGVLRTRLETYQSKIGSLDLQFETFENRLLELESKFGYLIRDFNDKMNRRLLNVEINLDTLKQTIDKYKLIIEDIE